MSDSLCLTCVADEWKVKLRVFSPAVLVLIKEDDLKRNCSPLNTHSSETLNNTTNKGIRVMSIDKLKSKVATHVYIIQY